ncbi:MAG TPA: inositol monophosphatase family protein, partial [Rhodocyclaceae bacterium]|nr:inositol monophosphatase family protein [Rhodocyclaceae bacterium]
MPLSGAPHVSVHCLALVERLRALGREVIMPRYMTAVRERKADGSLLTEVDVAAQEWLEESLRQIIDLPVMGEEMTADRQREVWSRGGDGIWIIDPIDGTTNFVNGIPFFGTSVAFYRNERPLFACVYNPATDEAFYAEGGRGAYLNGMQLPLRQPHGSLADCVAGVDFKRIPRSLADRLATRPP